MRHLTGPWNGYGADVDMVAYWRMNKYVASVTEGTAFPDDRLWQQTDTENNQLTFSGYTSSVSSKTSLFSPRVSGDAPVGNPLGSSAFRSGIITTHAPMFNPIGYPSTYASATGEWTISGWYENAKLSATTACFIEYGARIPGAFPDYVRLMYSISGLNADQQWYIEAGAVDGVGSTTQAVTRWLCPTLLPNKGMLSVCAKYNYNGGTPHVVFDWYHSSVPGLYAGRSAIQAGVPYIASVGDLRWSIGDVNQQTSGATISTYSRGFEVISEIGVWPRDIGPTGVRRLYRNCVKPWDDLDVLDTGPKVVTRVILEDGLEKDLSALFEMDYVQEVSISEQADDSGPSAKIKLTRKKGPIEDLSPISTTSDFTTYIKLRRRLRIERAFVPHLWQLQGWEWETAFVGYVDSWEFDDQSITIACSDQSAVLEDVQILENRAYNNYTAAVSMESHQQQILDDFRPKAVSGTSYPYKGMSSTGFTFKYAPPLHGLAGRWTGFSGYSTQLTNRIGVVDADWNLNYNDVSSGGVMSALKAVSDQIGFETRFIYHAPWDYFRLTTYDAIRQKTVNAATEKNVRNHYRVIRRAARVIDAEFLEPHGMVVGSAVSIANDGASGKPTYVQNYKVTASTSPYSVVMEALDNDINSGTATLSQTEYAFVLKNSYEYKTDQLATLSPLSANIDDIRNVVDVKFNRVSQGDIQEPIASVFVNASNQIALTSPINGRMRAIDPDFNGITLSMSGWLSPDTTHLNGDWTARRDENGSITFLRLNEPLAGFTGATIFYPTTNASNYSAHFKSPYITFNEIYAEDADSIAEYGVRMCGVYEGSTLGIDTPTEATRLADTILNDLAQPIGDLQITSRITPLDLNDYVKLPADVKTRYEESHRVMTITGREEKYASGTSEASYTLRVGLKPTRGRHYVNRMLTGFGTPAPANNMAVNKDLVKDYMPFSGIQVIDPGRLGIRMSSQLQPQTANKASLRMDQVQVWAGGSTGFIPTKDNKSGSFRGDSTSLKAKPGQAKYIKMAVTDKFGNMSVINGMGLASSATVYTVVPRFTALTAGALLFPSAATTERAFSSSTFTPLFISHSSTSFSSRGFDVYGNFVTASLLWRMPCDGVVTVDAEFDVRVNTGTGSMSCRVNKLREISGSLVSFGSTAVTSDTITNTAFGSTSRRIYSYNVSASSGDYLRLEVADGTGGKTFYIGSPVSSSATAPFLRYTLVSESRHGDTYGE